MNSIQKLGILAISTSAIACLTEPIEAATFKASIDNFSLVMPAVITNKFAFTLSTGSEQGSDPRGIAVSIGNAGATFDLFEFQQTTQPSGLLPPFSDTRVGRKGSAGSVEGFANPEGSALANTQAVLFGRLGNGTGLEGFPPPEDIPLTFDLSFDYSLSATANLALESASAAYEVKVTGLGDPDLNCDPLNLSIVANDANANNVACTFSTILKAGEFRDFDIQLKVAGAAVANNVPPPPPPPPPPIPPDIKVPEPSSILSLLAFGMVGAGSVLKRSQKQKKGTRKVD